MSGEAAAFVEKIEKYSCLYDFSCAEYSRKDITEKAWSEVAKEMNWKVADCKDKWRNIRNGFVRSLRAKLPSGSGSRAKKPYYLHDELQFLMPYIKPNAHSAASSNVTLNSDHIQEEEETELNENESEEPIHTDDSVNPQASSSSQANLDSMASANEKQSKKRRAVGDPVDKTLMEYLRKKKENLDRRNPEEDARKMFLLSLLPDVNQLSDIGFRQFKIKSMLLVDELLANGSFNRSGTPSYQSSTPSP
ncbi:uncharacterized protein [Palaemon carinicauda]|uniref:uncharacterized protein n=1 Tax=Palaemon carinicauda TaxID=392227 RepID=UPI0035B57968